jgi:hypothetical protein
MRDMHVAELAKLSKASPAWFTTKFDGLPSSLPLPSGDMVRVVLDEYSIGPSGGARTFFVRGKDDASIRGSLTMLDGHVHASLMMPKLGRVLIDPLSSHARALSRSYSAMPHASFFQKEYPRSGGFSCMDAHAEQRSAAVVPGETSYGQSRRILRLALAGTVQYGEAVTGMSGGDSGFQTATLGQMVIAVNRVNEVLLNEFSVTVALIANNENFVSTLAGDSISAQDQDGSALLAINGQWLTDKGVSAGTDYDLGHVFSTGGGGIAYKGTTCSGNSELAQGVTGRSDPTGDAFFIDYVAHEMGHQFGGDHTFNSEIGSCGGGNREAAAAVEPGSGVSIMAYAGICGADDLAPNSIPQYSWYSLSQMTGTFDNCPAGESNPGTVTVEKISADFTIPPSTNFLLFADASASESGAVLTYSWEESDVGDSATLLQGDIGNNPLFRPFPATPLQYRQFVPGDALGDIAPTTTRDMTFRVTARDNLPSGGHYGISNTVTVSVESSRSAFTVAPVDTSYDVGETVPLVWTTSNADLSQTLCIRLADATALAEDPNSIGTCVGTAAHSGTYDFVVPEGIAAGAARLFVIGQEPNTFFDTADFVVNSGSGTGSGFNGECTSACVLTGVTEQDSAASSISSFFF